MSLDIGETFQLLLDKNNNIAYKALRKYKYLKHITVVKPVTAGQCTRPLSVIAKYNPELRNDVLSVPYTENISACDDRMVLDRQPGMGPGENYGADGPEQKNYMALASMVMGILSIVTACCFLAAFVLGGMAVIFAALSRVDERLCGRGKAGLITGIVGIVAGLVSVVLWIALGA